MIRTIVLVLCLVSAGGITAYTLYPRSEPHEPVYTVPSRPDTAPRSAPGSKRIDPDDRSALAREIQRELKRVGCYGGEANGVWTASSRLAMRTFVEQVNAALPIDTPDPVLLSLVQGHHGHACAPGGAPASTAKATEAESKRDTAATAATVTAAGAAAALAIGASAAPARQEPKGSLPPNAARPTAPTSPAAASSAVASPGGPMPPEGIKAKAPRRTAQSPRPPKLVRDFMKAFGIK